jgi:hypothetical protein
MAVGPRLLVLLVGVSSLKIPVVSVLVGLDLPVGKK